MRVPNPRPLKDRPDKKRITINVPIPLYNGVIRATQFRYCTLTRWMMRAIVEKLKKEEEYFKDKEK
jgi:hypothetical protein